MAGCGGDDDAASAAADAAVQADSLAPSDTADGTADSAADTYAQPKQPGYTLAFRQTLANKAPKEFEAGEQAFFEDTWGQEKHSTLPPADFLVALWQADKAKWGVQFSNYGLVPDPGDDLPVGLKRGTVDASRVKDTCALCHTAQLPDGKLWAGMPATSLQWGKFQHDVDVAWEAAGNPPLVSAQERKALLATPPGGLVVDTDGKDIFVLNDFPLYAGLHKMSHFNRLGSGNDLKTEVYLSLFGATSAADFPPPAVADAVVAYFTVLDEPPAPMPVDASAVTRGRAVFEAQKCNTCHYDDISKNPPIPLAPLPERLPGEDPKFPQGSLATDGVFVDAAVNGVGGSGGPGPGLVDLLIFISDNGLDVSQPVGYVAANLRGLWASAPFLHNGAVATLEDLLTPPDQRPTTFTRHGFVYDTAKVSHSATGHSFGTTLPPADKADLIAYLRSL
jgi:cytochrome c5